MIACMVIGGVEPIYVSASDYGLDKDQYLSITNLSDSSTIS